MKEIFRGLCGKRRRDERGLTFVEVICAVAILSLVGGVIGTVLVVSTRTYRKGISETGIQQEAQLAANNIGNMVKDACSVVYGASGEQYLENGEKLMTNPDATPKMQAVGTTELSIITNEDIQYTVTYQRTNPAEPHGRLFYQEFDAKTGIQKSDLQIMAYNIADFSADTTDFKKNKTIKLTMKVEDETTNRRIPMEYTMTSRNDDVEGAVYIPHEDTVGVFFPEGDIVLVPGETYQIPLVVSGKLTQGLEWGSAGGLTAGALTLDYAEVTVPRDTTATQATIYVHTKDKEADGITPKAAASCKILIRKVTGVAVSHVTDTTGSKEGMYETAGTVFTFSASVSGNELVKRVAYDFDQNYKIAQSVTWSFMIKADGVEEDRRDKFTVEEVDGQWKVKYADFGSTFTNYFDYEWPNEDALIPSLTIKLKKDMPSDFELIVRATSKHALGENKANSQYGDMNNPDYYGDDLIKPRETKLDQGLKITLEPHEEGELKLGMKGGITSKVEFDFHDASDVGDEGSEKTYAKYDPANDEVKIKLGKDEKGSGPAGAEPYTFTIDVRADGVVKTTIKVYVCRIDTISIAVIDNYHEKKNPDGKPDDNATYDFRARFNVDTASLEDMQPVTKSLIHYNADGTPIEEALKKTLSSKITWELIDHSQEGKVVYTDYAVCEAGVGVKGIITKEYANKEFKSEDGSATFKVVEVKPARIEQDGYGSWFIKQLPEVDIAPSSIPKDYELKVTIRSLHPNGREYNRTGLAYIDSNVEASASILGDMSVSAPARLIVVEPGQGTNNKDDKTQADKEMVIPLKVTASAYKMEVTLSEKSEKGTQICDYGWGKPNPYKAENASSANEGKYTWYLGLNIDAKEKGNNLGRIKVHVDAIDSKGKVAASTDFELGVRRVDEINLRVGDNKKISEVNKAGQTMTVEAFPNGCDIKTTEYYDMQRDESGKACIWEQKGHGEYKDPCAMEWRMMIDGKEKLLSEWTEYIEKIYSEKIVSDDKKAVISFKLKKALPAGTKIRAYSLHARGSNGKEETEAGYVKYNKSGKEYKKNVYGELEIKRLLADTGMKRGTDFALNPSFDANSVHINEAPDNVGAEQRAFFRFREYGESNWSSGYMRTSTNDEVPQQLTARDMWLFALDKEYEVELIIAVYSNTTKKLYWPRDNQLLEAGAGWKEAGFTKGWDDSKGVTPETDYKRSYYLGKVSLALDGDNSSSWDKDWKETKLGFTNGSYDFAPYSEANPLKLKANVTNIVKVQYVLNYFHLGNGQAGTGVRLKKLVGGQWTDTKKEDNKLNIQEQTTYFEFQNINNDTVKGRYAACIYLDDLKNSKKIKAGLSAYDKLMNPQYESSPAKLELGSWSSNAGILYFDVE